MATNTNPEDVNKKYTDTAHTSDGASRSNLLTRDEFLRRVLYSGQLTKIAQHIALVVFLVAEGRNQLNLSMRDLKRITGWDHKAIKDHVTELEIFMRVTLGAGRAKAIWELQGVVEDALASAVVVGSSTPQTVMETRTPQDITGVLHPTNGYGDQDPTSANGRIGVHAPTTNGMYRHVPTSSFVAAGIIGALVPTTAAFAADVPTNPEPPAAIGAQVPTSPSFGVLVPTTAFSRERESISFNTSLSLSTPRASEEKATEEDPIQLNGSAIYGPGFKIDYKAIDLVASMIGMPKELARSIAEVCARDWAASGEKPRSPMARVKNAMMAHHNQGQVQDVRLEKAKADTAPKEGRAARLLRHVEQAAEKGGRS